MKWAKKQTGFTIVELLIVVVVIAILASISIVAYSGIQERARMSAALAHAAQISRSPDILNATGIWKFDACSGSAVVDSSEKANHGTVSGTALWSSDTPSGNGCSFQFNGSTYISTPASITSNYYLKAAWVKMTSCVGNNNVISSGGGSNGHALYIPINSGACNLRAGHNGTWNYVSDSKNMADGKWHYVVLEFTATNSTVGTVKLWRDGSLISENTNVPRPSLPDPNSVFIGSHNGTSVMTGLMDEVIVIAR